MVDLLGKQSVLAKREHWQLLDGRSLVTCALYLKLSDQLLVVMWSDFDQTPTVGNLKDSSKILHIALSKTIIPYKGNWAKKNSNFVIWGGNLIKHTDATYLWLKEKLIFKGIDLTWTSPSAGVTLCVNWYDSPSRYKHNFLKSDSWF